MAKPKFYLLLWRHSAVMLFLLCGLLISAVAQPTEPELVPFRQGSRWGYANHQRLLVLPLAYDEAGPFVEGVAWVRQGAHYGYINAKGTAITPVQFNRAGNFRQGRATVALNGEIFDIDTSGQRLSIPPDLDSETDYLEQGDLVHRQGRVGFRFTVGASTVVPAEYDEIQDLHHDGLLLVRQGTKWGVLNASGKLTLPLAYDAIRATPANGFAYPIVEQAGRFSYLSNEGSLLAKLKYSAAEPFIAEVARVTTPDGKTGYIDNRGQEFWQE